MSGSINKVILIGNLGQAPEIRFTQSGKKIANINLATSQKWRDKQSGEKRERTEWHRIVIFNEGLSDIVERFLRKGSKIYIEGQLRTRKWKDNNGKDHYTTEIIIEGYSCNLIMLDNRNILDESDNRNRSVDSQHTHSDPHKSVSEVAEIDDEIPF